MNISILLLIIIVIIISYNNDNITIDAKHSEMISHFKSLNNSLPSLKDKLKNMINEYNNKNPAKKNDIEYIIYKDKLREDINELKGKINSIINNDDINDYYLKVGSLLHTYYENIESSKNNDNSYQNFEENLMNYDNFDEDDEDELGLSEDEDDNKKKSKDNSYKSVLQFFNNRENDIIEDSVNDTKNDINNNNIGGDPSYTSMKISDFVKEESTFRKKNVLEEYLQKIDSNYVSKIKVDVNIFKCPCCTIEMTVYHSDGIQICEKCGTQQNILIESDKPSFKDPPMEVCYFSYKRINHYNESLYKTKKIIMNVGNNLLKEIKKMIFKFSRFLFM